MEYGNIHCITKAVSRIIQGTVMLGSGDRDRDFELLDSVYDAGINTFDAAHIYGGGECDRIFGQWVKERGIREKIVLIDKGCHHNADRQRVTPSDITSDLYDCMARLKFDYIDIFAMHRDDPSVPVGPLVETFNEHIEAGRIGGYGGSNWSHRRIQEANRYAEDHGLIGFCVSSPQYSLAECIDDPWGGKSITITGGTNKEAYAWYKKSRMAVFSWSSLSGGFFSGRFSRSNLASFTDAADLRCVRCYCSEDNFRRLDRAGELAEKKNLTVAQIALAFLLCGPLNCFPLMAAWTPEQALENAKAADVKLTHEELSWLNLDMPV